MGVSMILIASCCVLAAGATFSALWLGVQASGEARRQQNLKSYLDLGGQGDESPKEERRSALGDALARAGVTTDANSAAIMLCVVMAALAVLGLLIAGPAAALIGALVPPLLAFFWLRSAAKKRALLLDEQLARALPMVAANIRSNSTLEASLATTADNVADPLKSELAAAVAYMQVDGDTVAALENMAARTGSADLKLLTAAVRCNKQVGGSIADSLDRISETIEARMDMRRLIASETSATRMSVKLIFIIFVIIMLIVTVPNPDAVEFYSQPVGILCLLAAVALMATGTLVINKLADIPLD